MKYLAVTIALLALAFSGSAEAQTTTQFVLPCITFDPAHSTGLCTAANSLTGANWGAATTIYMGGYWNTADGGQGAFVRNGTSCTANGGTIIRDNGGGIGTNCWYRQDISRDLRQWGMSCCQFHGHGD